MTKEQFNLLQNGPFRSACATFSLNRLAAALRYVVGMTGTPGEVALQYYCSVLKEEDAVKYGEGCGDAAKT
jgi:hypothetical protein